MLHHAHFDNKGGLLTFAAILINVCFDLWRLELENTSAESWHLIERCKQNSSGRHDRVECANVAFSKKGLSTDTR
jgi:hypothetical protein